VEHAFDASSRSVEAIGKLGCPGWPSLNHHSLDIGLIDVFREIRAPEGEIITFDDRSLKGIGNGSDPTPIRMANLEYVR